MFGIFSKSQRSMMAQMSQSRQSFQQNKQVSMKIALENRKGYEEHRLHIQKSLDFANKVNGLFKNIRS